MKPRPVNTGRMARDRARKGGSSGSRDRGPAMPVRQFVRKCQEAVEQADELPDRASDFQEGVTERLQSMADWAEENDTVTAKMVTALENIVAGIDRWLERKPGDED